MASTSFLDEISSRENYLVFQTRELALIEKMRLRSKLLAERERMAKELEIADEDVLQDLQEMGFNRKTASLLHLVPLIQVAWSEGTVTSLELKKIIEIAGKDTTLSKTEYEQLIDWVTNKPSDEFFANSLSVIRLMMESLTDPEKAASKKDLITYCTAVAQASQLLPGANRKLSDIEKKQIAEVAKAIGRG